MGSIRSARVGDAIKREITLVLQRETQDSRLAFVTITSVKVSPDLRQAQVYYSVLGNQEQQNKSKAALKHAMGYIQQQVARKLRLKYHPNLEFLTDPALEYGERIDRLLDEIHKSQNDRTD